MPYASPSARSTPMTAQLKGTAFEYLESATPPDTRQLLLPLLEADAEGRRRSADAERPLHDLLASKARVNTNTQASSPPPWRPVP